jgi:hypothetical protein
MLRYLSILRTGAPHNYVHAMLQHTFSLPKFLVIGVRRLPFPWIRPRFHHLMSLAAKATNIYPHPSLYHRLEDGGP